MFCLTPTISMISGNIFIHKFDLILINNLLGNKYPFNNNVYTIDEQNKLLFTLKCSYQNLTKTSFSISLFVSAVLFQQFVKL